MKKIDKNTTIQEALSLGDDAFEILSSYFGPGCMACGAAAFETLEMACMSHGLSEDFVSKIVAELQTVADKESADKKENK